jgi:uncharacterized cofD-like protein
MLKSFLKHYFELPEETQNIVCLGGGIGTAQVLKGLKNPEYEVSAIVSMADDGGSAGRLRRAFSVPPPGDLVNCLAALSDEESVIKQLFLYRFKGKRYGKDTDLGGQKLGNLIFVALSDILNGDTNKALVEFSKIISSHGQVLPATLGDVNIWAKTADGKKVVGEQNIDLGNYKTHALKSVYLSPADVKAYDLSLKAIKSAQLIVVGPGDLFSTVLPVVIVQQIKKALIASPAKKVFIVNVANKPFETHNFKVSNYLETMKDHIGQDIFDKILVNTSQDINLPPKLKYSYVKLDWENLSVYKDKIIAQDLIDTNFPTYHDSAKIAALLKNII